MGFGPALANWFRGMGNTRLVRMCALPLFLGVTLFAQHALAQNKQAKPVKPEVDPDAATYDTYKYSPPGARKSVEIGNFYFRKKEYKAALSRFQEAAQEDSNYAPAYLGLGKVYEKIGLKTKALDAYKKFLGALPSEKDALDAKDAQHAVTRLEAELKKTGTRN